MLILCRLLSIWKWKHTYPTTTLIRLSTWVIFIKRILEGIKHKDHNILQDIKETISRFSSNILTSCDFYYLCYSLEHPHSYSLLFSKSTTPTFMLFRKDMLKGPIILLFNLNKNICTILKYIKNTQNFEV